MAHLELDGGEDGDGGDGHVREEEHEQRVHRHVQRHHLFEEGSFLRLIYLKHLQQFWLQNNYFAEM